MTSTRLVPSASGFPGQFWARAGLKAKATNNVVIKPRAKKHIMGFRIHASGIPSSAIPFA
jgi:hypothetical protein